jgi:hypothetical protein
LLGQLSHCFLTRRALCHRGCSRWFDAKASANIPGWKPNASLLAQRNYVPGVAFDKSDDVTARDASIRAIVQAIVPNAGEAFASQPPSAIRISVVCGGVTNLLFKAELDTQVCWLARTGGNAPHRGPGHCLLTAPSSLLARAGGAALAGNAAQRRARPRVRRRGACARWTAGLLAGRLASWLAPGGGR